MNTVERWSYASHDDDLVLCRLISDNKPRKMDAGSFLLLTNLAEIALRALLKDADYNPLDLPPPADEDASSHQASRQAEAAVSHTARSSIDRLYLHRSAFEDAPSMFWPRRDLNLAYHLESILRQTWVLVGI